MNDPISRQAAIDSIRQMSPELFSAYQHNTYVDKQEVMIRLMALPSAQKPGRWIMKEKVYDGLIGDSVCRYECSECGFSDEHNSSREVPFCWHCGARMESE